MNKLTALFKQDSRTLMRKANAAYVKSMRLASDARGTRYALDVRVERLAGAMEAATEMHALLDAVLDDALRHVKEAADGLPNSGS